VIPFQHGPITLLLILKCSGRMLPMFHIQDNVNDLFRTGNIFENSISINGGNEKTSLALTATQLNQTGYVP
jgi:hypothetical protein